ncbi:hypothetical protein FHL15_003982 [Xylaria flabelliformis]|uniref:Essential protein Yae1 N-terminal domain-containing protein n=1 Tax=Xylaria flabelliformis TaxID=2512241 RepID=A0A553I505_9PEZI|nr:hypothetical protein FHL15_003982 [Xylaria flabelliformis]
MSSSHDPFDDLLNLEEEYYREGYEEGLRDGAESGRVEGYSLGLSKGFEKFVEAGRLQSKAVVWANRIPKYQQKHHQQDRTSKEEYESARKAAEGQSETAKSNARLPPIHSNPRLEKNIETLYGLVEPGTLSTNNDDEAVNDFDSRMKGAHGKLRIIERAVGEGTTSRNVNTLSPAPSKNENIEDVGKIRSPAEARSTDV